jgi:hypothetical protein
MDSSSNGKYSLDGRPPPREMRPGVARNFAASFKELPLRSSASWLMMSTLKRWWCSLKNASHVESTYGPIAWPLACYRMPSIESSQYLMQLQYPIVTCLFSSVFREYHCSRWVR